MINNNNFEISSAGGTRVMGAGLQAEMKSAAIELGRIMQEIIHPARAAIHTMQQQHGIEQPSVAMGM